MNVLHLVRVDIHNKLVLPAQAGIQRLKSLDPGQQHAGMTIKWDSSDSGPFIHFPSGTFIESVLVRRPGRPFVRIPVHDFPINGVRFIFPWL
jgi:hypothetical protein